MSHDLKVNCVCDSKMTESSNPPASSFNRIIHMLKEVWAKIKGDTNIFLGIVK